MSNIVNILNEYIALSTLSKEYLDTFIVLLLLDWKMDAKIINVFKQNCVAE